MQKTKNIIGILALAALVVGVIVFSIKSPAESPAPITGGTEQPSASYTLAQVAQHGDSASCWTAISGKVYDLTAWISQHPGGEQAILSICGIDGTDAFLGQHGDNRRANAELGTFVIGTLQ